MIILICGRCRAGKTTYSKRYSNVVHLDSTAPKIADRYKAVLRIVAGTDADIVIDGVYSTASQRMELLNAYKGKGARCVWLDTPLEIIASRMTRRWHPNLTCIYPKEFEEPTEAEGWDKIERII